ncbi:hypothetical protein GOP47_0002732 [Adiantum capillus-veneris]|uniref:Uncharacterized protein n=1 Tax=Adiantum capillus-veneris TaxID=13818 RepID=A0A9D4ZPF7_ADICA|nr:hypothetical protein GOP47_0002732 [Adiantum capillus-veneris]
MASSTEENAKQAEDQPPSTSSSAGIADEPSPPLPHPPPGAPQEQGSTSSARASSHTQSHPKTQPPLMFDLSGMRWNPEMAGGNRNMDQSSSLLPLVPIFCPVPLPAYQGQLNEQTFRSGGIFAVPMVPVIGPLPGFPPSGLIPVSYNIPLSTPVAGNATSSSSSEPVDRAIPAQAHEPAAMGPPQGGGLNIPPPVVAQAGQPHLPDGHRQIVRRFHVALQIDLLLILKLAVVVFIFNQDGSRDRLFLLLFLAGLAYLYQTGALSPLLRWISQSAQRAMMPPQQQQPARAVPAERGLGQGGIAAADVPGQEGDAIAAADNHAAPPVEGGGPANMGGDRVQPQAPPVQGATWWGILKEVQMIVVGFVTSLLPGFHQHMD